MYIKLNEKILFPRMTILPLYTYTSFWLLLFCTYISDAVCMPVHPLMLTMMPTHHDKWEHKGYRNSLKQLYNQLSENNFNYIPNIFSYIISPHLFHLKIMYQYSHKCIFFVIQVLCCHHSTSLLMCTNIQESMWTYQEGLPDAYRYQRIFMFMFGFACLVEYCTLQLTETMNFIHTCNLWPFFFGIPKDALLSTYSTKRAPIRT